MKYFREFILTMLMYNILLGVVMFFLHILSFTIYELPYYILWPILFIICYISVKTSQEIEKNYKKD